MHAAVQPVASDEREDRVRMVGESAEAALREDRQRARALRFTRPGFSRERWKAFVDLGWLMLRVPEADGGLGFGLAEICSIAHQMGRQLTPEPVLSAALIAPCLPSESRAALLEGREIILPIFTAFDTPTGASRHDPIHLAEGADAFLIEASAGCTLVSRSELGNGLRFVDTHDGGHVGILGHADGVVGKLAAELGPVREEAALALAAYLFGLAEAAFEITLEYLKDRRQFDKPIGSFQALQHKAVDLYLELSLTKAAVGAAADTLDAETDSIERARAVSLAKARAARAAGLITQSAIQLHGGIGYTDEADIGLYLRKAMAVGGLLGTERFHRNRAFQLSGLIA